VSMRALARSPLARDCALGAVLLVAGLLIANGVSEFRAQELSLWLVYGLLALSLAFVWGKAGIFSFGQAAFFGIGGYAYGVMSIDVGMSTNETVSAIVAGLALAAVFSAFVGYFVIYGNVSDVYLAIITLATSLVLYTLMSTTADPKYHIGDALLGATTACRGCCRSPWAPTRASPRCSTSAHSSPR
jgi:branched-chain amino acid transport system permease protein